MARFVHDTNDDYSECTVCGTDTRRLCSPCGDPVCVNCHCPHSCEDTVDAAPAYLGAQTRYVEAAA